MITVHTDGSLAAGQGLCWGLSDPRHHEASLWGEGSVLKLDCGDGAQLCKYTKSH